MYALHTWAVYGIGCLHLWLIVAYVLDSRRTGRRHSWAVGALWFAWLLLLALIPRGTPSEFYRLTPISFVIIRGLPLVFISLHLFGKAQFIEYSHPRDVLLLRWPHGTPASFDRALWQSLGIGAITLAL